MKKIKIFLLTIVLFAVVLITSNFFINAMNSEIPPAEQAYITNVLDMITLESSKDEVISLLGEPSRDIGLKVNWWVKIGENKSRIGVYFSSTTGKATRVNLDGIGRFYYRKDLK